MEDLVLIFKYVLSHDVVEKCLEEDRKITKADVKTSYHEILENNKIEYFDKLNEEWGGSKKRARYTIIVETYVRKQDEVEARKLLAEVEAADFEEIKELEE